MNEDDFDDEEYVEPQCSRCHDTGKVICDDGHYQYLGQDEMPCSCPMGMQWVGKLGPRRRDYP